MMPRDLLIADNHGCKEKLITMTALIGTDHSLGRGALFEGTRFATTEAKMVVALMSHKSTRRA
jgi:hypothetical protein